MDGDLFKTPNFDKIVIHRLIRLNAWNTMQHFANYQITLQFHGTIHRIIIV